LQVSTVGIIRPPEILGNPIEGAYKLANPMVITIGYKKYAVGAY
jgi:hypothetical protein